MAEWLMPLQIRWFEPTAGALGNGMHMMCQDLELRVPAKVKK
jgi:hypothetical protein